MITERGFIRLINGTEGTKFQLQQRQFSWRCDTVQALTKQSIQSGLLERFPFSVGNVRLLQDNRIGGLGHFAPLRFDNRCLPNLMKNTETVDKLTKYGVLAIEAGCPLISGKADKELARS